MMRKTLLIILIFVFFGLAFGQETEKKATTNCRGGGVMIGKAISLPKPVFPQGGNYQPLVNTIIVDVTIDENGNVVEANPISGHPLFRLASVKAARFARFSPAIFDCQKKNRTAEISYTFDRNDFSISVRESPLRFIEISLGNLNDRAISLPMPKRPFGNYIGGEKSVVGVYVKIDIQSGTVVEAKANSGHPLFRKIAEDSALLAKFDFSKGYIPAKYGTGILTYKVEDFLGSENKLIEEKKHKDLGIINGLAKTLPKPIYPQEAKDFCVSGKVEIEVLFDEKGNVIEAKVIAGDELLRQSSLDAVKKAKFQIRPDSKGSKIRGLVVYNFKSERKCLAIDEIVNNRTIFKPKMVLTDDQSNLLGEAQSELVDVQIIVDMEGNVTHARALSGNPRLHKICVASALLTKFSPTLINGPKIIVRAKLRFKFNKDGTIEF